MDRIRMVSFWVLCVLFLTNVYKANASEVNICRAVVKHANNGTLDRLAVSPFQPDSTTNALLRERNIYGDIAKVDINGDGKTEYVVHTSQGTMHAGGFEFYDSEWKPIKVEYDPGWNEDKLRWALDLRLIQYQGKAYILGGTNERLLYLAGINQNNIQSLICEFGQSPTPSEKLIESSNDKVCKTILDRRAYYARFIHTHALTYQGVQEAGFGQTAPGERAARIDIDNDGVPDMVVQLDLASGAGRGCDATTLGVLNKTRNGLDTERTRILPGPRCQGSIDWPFTFEGAIYIDSKMPAGFPINNHTVSQVKNGQITTVCNFSVIVQHHLIGEGVADTANDPRQNLGGYLLRRLAEHPSADELHRVSGLIDEKFRKSSVDEMISESSLYIDDRMTVLDYAAALGRDDLVQLLLEHNVNPNLKARNGRFPLAEAIYRGTASGAQLLLERGANSNAPGITRSILDDALQSHEDREKKLELLLKHGANPDTPSAITHAIQNDQLWALRLFVTYGARFEGKAGAEYLSLAKRLGKVETENFLRKVFITKSRDECTSEKLSDMTERCNPRLLRSIDSELNHSYKTRMRNLNTDRKSVLRSAQQTWLKQRNYECEIQYRGHTIDGLFAHVLADPKRMACMIRVTRGRIAEINNQIDISRNAYRIPELQIVHAYEAARPKGAPSGYQNDNGNVLVRVHITDRPIVLVLSSMRPITWAINADKGAIIKEVILSSWYPSKITGIDSAALITHRHFGFPTDHEPPARESITKACFTKRLETYTNLEVKNFQYTYYGKEFDVR